MIESSAKLKISKLRSAALTFAVLAVATSPGFGQSAPANDSAEPTTQDSEDVLSRSQTRAATWDALHSLRADIESRSIDANFTVADFIDRTQSKHEWNTALRRRAQQIGGPRWIDGETCQVRMEIDGDRVAAALIEIAAAHPHSAPLPSEALTNKMSLWSRKLFSATGTSLRADRAMDIRASDSPAWNAVDDSSRQRAIAEARDAAISRIFDIVRNVSLTDSEMFGALLTENADVQRALRAWLASQPATAVRFGDDLEVSYAISLSGDDLLDRAVAELTKSNVALSASTKLEEARAAFRARLGDSAMVGHSRVGSDAVSAASAIPGSSATTTTTNAVTSATLHASTSTLAPPPLNRAARATALVLPPTPPAWAFRQINAEATASSSGNALKTREAAEDRATESIRQKLSDFSLDGATSVGEAAKTSPQIKRAVERAVRRARIYHVDYFPDGSVGVKMSLDARDFWFAIERN